MKTVVWKYIAKKKFLGISYTRAKYRVIQDKDGYFYPQKRGIFGWNMYIEMGSYFFFLTHTICYFQLTEAIKYLKFHEKDIDKSETP